jgi:protein-S-isoprenylcysteine O-methyltransferase Ste14
LVGLFGLALRAWAAGYLHKQQVLTVTGPYAYTRNPLYLGSAVLALGVAIATRSWISSLLLGVYFTVFYSIVMRKEENELRPRHAEIFDRYAAAVPLFFPRLSPAKLPGSDGAAFSLTQYKKNHEWQAAVGFLLLLVVLVLIWRFRAL